MKQQRQRKHQQQMSNTMDSFNHIINHNSNHNLPHINDHHYYRKSNIMTNHDTKLHRLNYHHSNDRLKRKIDLNFMNFSKFLSLSSSSSSSLSSLIILVISYLLLNGIFIVNANNNINNQIIKTNEMNDNNYNYNNNHRTMINESMIMSNITLSTRLLLADSLLMDLNLSDAIEKLTNIWLLIHNHDHQNNNQQMNNDINDRLLQELSMISKLKSIKKEPKFNDFSEKIIFNQTNVNGEDDMMISDDPSAYNDDSRNSTMTKSNEFIASTSDINESKQMNHQQQQQQQRQRIMKKFITNYANCSACTKNDEQTKKLRIESIKMKILNKLNMKHAPNVSLEMLPKIPPINSMLNRLSRMMNDQSVSADNDDQHPIGSSSSSSSIRLMSKILDPNDHYGPTTNDYYDNNNSNENDNQSILNNDNNDSSENDNENDYDELMSAEKSIVFAQQKTPIDRVINQDLRSQFFKFPSNINQHHVKKAFLWVYLKGSSLSSSSPSSSILSSSQTSTATQSKINSWIVIYQIVRGTSTQLSLIKSKRISYNTTRKGGWIHLRVEKLVSKWFENPDTNLGIVIHAFDSNGQQLSVIHSDDVAQDSPLRPFIEISVDRRNSLQKRRKRTIGLNCEDKSAEVRCCRYPLTVDFEQFGWDWIIAPKRYQANYCSGECPFVLMNQYPHTHLIQQINMNAIGPCCSPRKMSSISMLYLDSDYNVIYGILPNMVVERCGCS